VIAAAILLYLVVKAIVLIPYNAWSKRRNIPPGLEKEEPERRVA
jgi:hypothetical protein